jgi:uncharacterized membrane protein HdeD (DUF308 family)
MEGSTFLIVRGIVGVLFGFLAFVWPGVTLAALVVIFGAYAVVDGVVNLWLGLTRTPSSPERSWVQVVLGLIGIGAGVVTFIMPGWTLFVLVMFIAAWAIVRGALELVAAVRLRRVISGEWLLALAGVLSILFGVAVFVFPAAGALSIAWLLGAYAFAAGVVLIALGIRLKRPTAA